MKILIRSFLVTIALVFGLSGPAMALKKVQPRHTDITQITSKNHTSNSVAQAFSRCGLARGWSFEKNGSNQMIGRLTVRGKHYVEVTVAYSGKAYTIDYRYSENMKYNAEKNLIHKRYSSWVENLDNDVRGCLR